MGLGFGGCRGSLDGVITLLDIKEQVANVKALASAAEAAAVNAGQQVSSLQAIAKMAELTAQATEANRLSTQYVFTQLAYRFVAACQPPQKL
jgi:hypothetical protein